MVLSRLQSSRATPQFGSATGNTPFHTHQRKARHTVFIADHVRSHTASTPVKPSAQACSVYEAESSTMAPHA